MRTLATLAAAALLAGCTSSQIRYTPPITRPPVTGANAKVINKPRDVVWAAAIPAIGKEFFVINNVDKSSGLMNLSYSGELLRYVDCGHINGTFTNAAGTRTFDFAGAAPQARYVHEHPTLGFLDNFRRMALDGRINLIFEELSPTATRVTANVRYIVTRSGTVSQITGPSGALLQPQRLMFNVPYSSNISFNTGSRATFALNADGEATQCVPTGLMERELLNLMN